jgi:hypothetical protein
MTEPHRISIENLELRIGDSWWCDFHDMTCVIGYASTMYYLRKDDSKDRISNPLVQIFISSVSGLSLSLISRATPAPIQFLIPVSIIGCVISDYRNRK